MKKGIHPEYNTKAKATCSCGQSFIIGYLKDSISIEVCSNCHPFYSGKQKVLDTAGMVDKFKRREKMATKKTPKKKKVETEA